MRLRVRAEALCFRGNKVLCGYAPAGYVIFPGGGVDHNESAVHAAKRECMEEADRVLTTCTPAHEPTVQVWPAGYADQKGMKWAKGYQGGLTHWMTGSCSETPVHADGVGRHEDYEDIFDWRPLDEVLKRLVGDMNGDWADDVRARIAIIKAYKAMHVRHKVAMAVPGLTTPPLTLEVAP